MVHTPGRNPLHAPNPATRIAAGIPTTRLGSSTQNSAIAFTTTGAGIHSSSHFLMLQELQVPDPAQGEPHSAEGWAASVISFPGGMEGTSACTVIICTAVALTDHN